MNDPLLQCFRDIAEAMDPQPKRWQWIGEFDSQRMFGISESRARDFADRFGGTASNMDDAKPAPIDNDDLPVMLRRQAD